MWCGVVYICGGDSNEVKSGVGYIYISLLCKVVNEGCIYLMSPELMDWAI